MKKLFLVLVAILLQFSIGNCQTSQKDLPVLKGSYLGQTPPGSTPEIFAPGILCTGLDEKEIAIYPSGEEIYFTITVNGFRTIAVIKTINGNWGKPEIAGFSGIYFDSSPSIHPDGSRIFFTSKRPLDDSIQYSETNLNIWYADRIGDKWTTPKPIGSPINGKWKVFCSSVAKNGNIYFAKETATENGMYIYRSKYINNHYQEPEKLPVNINGSNYQDYPYISPDETYIVFLSGLKNDLLGGINRNLYVSFKLENEHWSSPINLGSIINTNRLGEASSISYDGKYFFFHSKSQIRKTIRVDKPTYSQLKNEFIDQPNNSTFDIYWVSTKIIEELKPK